MQMIFTSTENLIQVWRTQVHPYSSFLIVRVGKYQLAIVLPICGIDDSLEKLQDEVTLKAKDRLKAEMEKSTR
jgi:hypothetical protein